MISFVNGFLCTSGCDEAKAKRGIDPHPKADPREPDGKARKDKIEPESAKEDPAVIFGGSLADVSASHRVAATGDTLASNPTATEQLAASIDLLV